jgi:hypothetical protein
MYTPAFFLLYPNLQLLRKVRRRRIQDGWYAKVPLPLDVGGQRGGGTSFENALLETVHVSEQNSQDTFYYIIVSFITNENDY